MSLLALASLLLIIYASYTPPTLSNPQQTHQKTQQPLRTHGRGTGLVYKTDATTLPNIEVLIAMKSGRATLATGGNERVIVQKNKPKTQVKLNLPGDTTETPSTVPQNTPPHPPITLTTQLATSTGVCPPVADVSVTLLTHTTPDRLYMIPAICERWGGSVIVVVYGGTEGEEIGGGEKCDLEVIRMEGGRVEEYPVNVIRLVRGCERAYARVPGHVLPRYRVLSRDIADDRLKRSDAR